MPIVGARFVPVVLAASMIAAAWPTTIAAVDAPVAQASPAQTAIYSVSPSPVVVHDGDRIVGVVHTSTDVVSVTARVSVLSRALERTGPGVFHLYVQMPRKVPFFLHRSYTLTVQARTARGVTIERAVAVFFS